MSLYVLYDDTGTVRQTGFIDDTLLAAMREYIAANGAPGITGPQVLVMDGMPFPIDQMTALTYVDAGSLRTRVAIEAVVSTYDIAADGIDEAEITDLPIPCTVSISGAVSVDPFELEDGILVITSDVVGDILVSVTAAPPWLAWSAVLHAS